jgi:hypothetical protein
MRLPRIAHNEVVLRELGLLNDSPLKHSVPSTPRCRCRRERQEGIPLRRSKRLQLMALSAHKSDQDNSDSQIMHYSSRHSFTQVLFAMCGTDLDVMALVEHFLGREDAHALGDEAAVASASGRFASGASFSRMHGHEHEITFNKYSPCCSGPQLPSFCG